MTIWYALTIAVLLVANAVATGIFLSHAAHRRAEHALQDGVRNYITLWRQTIADDQTPPRAAADSAALDFQDQTVRVAVYDSAGRRVAVSATAPLMAPVLERRAPVTIAGATYTVGASRSMALEAQSAVAYAHAMLVAIPIALIVASLGGYLLARASLAPVGIMAARARRIGAHTLNERLPVVNPRDELGELAQVVNELLARLERAFAEHNAMAERQRRFMADASHELRTPLTGLSSAADVALKRADRDPAELREALDIVRGEALRMGRLVDDLLLLARADAGDVPLRFAPLFLEEIVQDVVRTARARANHREIGVTAPPAAEAPFVGDAHLLHRLVLIILDNAIKFTPPGGRVAITLDRDVTRSLYTLIVHDSGPGVPPWARPHIFDRFYRADASRTHAMSSSDGDRASTGLGLAIGAWIATAHGGTIALDESAAAGARFIVRLPIRDE
ncbi:MAG: ATP-binding protein [Gemmatimonadota bacterium]|nr:ATP-binding protein [Gemmatimonadota bacterium]